MLPTFRPVQLDENSTANLCAYEKDLQSAAEGNCLPLDPSDIEVMDILKRMVIDDEGAISLDAQVDFFENRHLDDMIDQLEKEYVASIASEGYNLLLNPNQYNSCYIDARLELLWHSTMPIISKFGSARTPSGDSTFDGISWETYKTPKNLTSRIHASQKFRKFVWTSENKFEKATNQTFYLFSNIFLTISFEIHRAKAIVLHRTESIDQQSDLGQYTSIIQQSMRCMGEPECVLQFNVVGSDPPLLILGIGSNHHKSSADKRLTTIQRNGRFIAELDNIQRPGIKVLKDSPSDDDAAKIFKSVKNPIIACYKKTVRHLNFRPHPEAFASEEMVEEEAGYKVKVFT
ncbi:hypothetical protein VTP01DRAFT_6744 [Rhizomucor pusillus]|uniref:uncharacterized protein n=1 Tax=Rhizomucor pusillus TaxID=4840 RepID=UPI003741F059